jgi:hypothetical protein
MIVLLAAVAWRDSYDFEFAYVRPSRDGRPYDTGYVVLTQGKLYLLDGIPADRPYAGQLYERYPARWWWSPYQSNGFSIDIIERSGDGVSWSGFAYRTTRLGFRAIILPCWFVVVLLVALPAPMLARGLRRLRRRLANRCVNCGYDLRGSPGQCPECGVVPPSLEATSVEPAGKDAIHGTGPITAPRPQRK